MTRSMGGLRSLESSLRKRVVELRKVRNFWSNEKALLDYVPDLVFNRIGEDTLHHQRKLDVKLKRR